jgi:LytS/YehU family sensor histidine kinase
MQALQNQLDPHFIFNSLNSIQSYILEDNSDDALEYLNDFSMVLRKNIDNANKNFIALSDEINYLRNYLKLEQMRFSEHFTYEVISDPEMNLSKLKLPPMFIHPFVENAIRYGLSGVGGEGKLKVYFSEKKKGYLSCFLEDNGIGRDKAWQIQNASNIQDHSKSMEIIDGRINLLNQVVSDNEKFFYRVEDLFDENGEAIGTRVELGFPQII